MLRNTHSFKWAQAGQGPSSQAPKKLKVYCGYWLLDSPLVDKQYVLYINVHEHYCIKNISVVVVLNSWAAYA